MEIHLMHETTGETRILRVKKSKKELIKLISMMSFKESKKFSLFLLNDDGVIACRVALDLQSKKDFRFFYRGYRFLLHKSD